MRRWLNFDDEICSAWVTGGVLDIDAVNRAQAASEQTNSPIERTILELGLVGEEQLYRSIAAHLACSFFEVSDCDLSLSEEIDVPIDFFRRASIAPVRQTESALVVATSNPRATDEIRAVAFRLGRRVEPSIATPTTIRTVLERAIARGDEVPGSAATEEDIARLRALANEGPVVKLVNDIITGAATNGASDIHIEADPAGANVRYRIDGSLETARSLTEQERISATSRLKVMARLNISERRRPQDGHIQVPIQGRNVDIRLSTLPTKTGESVVLRLLDQGQIKLDWKNLGFAQDRVTEIEGVLKSPNGIFLVTGPTGSGKTTTLYTALSSFNASGKKIVTVEDPIEYSLPGTNQVQVDPEIDVTFATALRSILRQDPDIVMVGEIRDSETAEIAIRAALVGRLVLSTVHTNDALTAVTRLLDLGVAPYLIGATLRGVLAQRLVKRLCTLCSGVGCAACGQTGHTGRVVVSEYLGVTAEIADAISQNSPHARLSLLANETGFTSMAEDGSRLVRDGFVSADNIASILGNPTVDGVLRLSTKSPA